MSAHIPQRHAKQDLLLDEGALAERIFQHIDAATTDLGESVWQEPVSHYLSQARFEAECTVIRRHPTPFCPSAALPQQGSYLARVAAGNPIVVSRDDVGTVRAFINACRHRGMQVAEGSGCAKALSCPYHGWTYGLDGTLKGIPGQAGFPALDRDQHRLVEISAIELGGIIYVQQEGEIEPSSLEYALDYFSADQPLFDQKVLTDSANWKLLYETLMEGYHIKSLHRESFYPFGYDNLNVVETFGPHSRVVYPFQRIEQMRDVPPNERNLTGLVTSVYMLFPNASISVLSKHTNLVILEPISPNESRWVIYSLINTAPDGTLFSLEEAKRDAVFVNDSGQEEDRAAAAAIQQTLASGANSHFTFGHFEKAIVHFHEQLERALQSSHSG
jgi:phenylpropionate dioxygenase-like ring-hydroxylating dioxygenase large terminal subunit